MARAEEGGQAAKALNDKAMAEFGLGDYGPAAEHYEAAFRLKPDGALLYNAAQSHRLAGNKKRALELYRSFVRLYGAKNSLAPDARRRIGELERTMGDEDKHAPAAGPTPGPTPARTTGSGAAPPTSAGTAAGSPATPGPAQTPSAATRAIGPTPTPMPTSMNLSASAAPPPETSLVSAGPAPPTRSILASPWLWAGVGAAVAGAVILLVVLNPSYPSPTFGQTAGN